ncbi:hypothetical protein B0H16DRAFT_1472748 [Mycena metata]|uniref:Uncharacterized protein n=1 Tax=Mycena metata TaxID=1033252 RepID=A0AAD7HM73_9AGAR|nr:hypothetical protein B0H16DRAFT_1472748 [Mycena metata]
MSRNVTYDFGDGNVTLNSRNMFWRTSLDRSSPEFLWSIMNTIEVPVEHHRKIRWSKDQWSNGFGVQSLSILQGNPSIFFESLQWGGHWLHFRYFRRYFTIDFALLEHFALLTIAQVYLKDISKCVAIVANTSDVLVDTLKITGMEAILNTMQSLLTLAQLVMLTIKQDKNECVELIEQTHELLNAIITMYIKSDTGAELPPSTLNQIVKFTEYFYTLNPFIFLIEGFRTLHKIHCRGSPD